MRKSIVLIFLLVTMKAWAFPDTIRHGYTSCTTCHVSPGGGGLMTDYGRSLSKELMSTWGSKGEEQLLHGFVNLKKPKFLERVVLGGNARYLSRYQKTKTTEINEGFWMQAQVRVGVLFEKIKFIVSAGSIENPRQSDQIIWVAPEYYAIASPNPSNSIRFGRFEPMYGLRLPDHNLWVKSEVGFVPWVQRDTIEFNIEDQSQLLSLAGFQSTSKTTSSQQSTGYAINWHEVFGERTRLGMSAFNSEGQGARSRALTGHGTISYTDKTFTHLEFSRVSKLDVIRDVSFMRTGHELVKGFIPFVQFQSRANVREKASREFKYGAGVQWLPRPHFEIMLNAEQLKKKNADAFETNLLFHYYL